jgi:hypothetical protein
LVFRPRVVFSVRRSYNHGAAKGTICGAAHKRHSRDIQAKILAVFETDPTKERSPDRGQGYQKGSFIYSEFGLGADFLKTIEE